MREAIMKRNIGPALACAVAALLALGCSRTPAPAADTASATPAVQPVPAPQAEPAPPAPDPGQAYVLPGALTPRTDLAALRAQYGEANVREDQVPGAEGETFPGAILFPDDPQRRAYVYFGEGDASRQVASVRVFDAGSRWTLDNGVRIGMPLSELAERNGKPLRFYGLAWDYGGTITSWNGGAMAPAKGATSVRTMQLGAREGAERYPMGEDEFSSDDPAFPEMSRDVVVAEIGIAFVEPDAADAP